MLDRHRLHEELVHGSDLWDHLPPAFNQPMVAPYLWPASTPLTLDMVSKACLKALFRSCHTHVVATGYWMVCASQEEKAAARKQQLDQHKGWTVEEWWKQHEHLPPGFNDMDHDQQHDLQLQAAMAVFSNPPVALQSSRGELTRACMVMHPDKYKAGIKVKKQELHLRLQRAPTEVTVPCHVMVAWLFLGPRKKAKHVVCHYDVPPRVEAITWQHNEVQETVGEAVLRPAMCRCLSRKCVSPMCLHWSTQKLNAATGKTIKQMQGRKARAKLA